MKSDARQAVIGLYENFNKNRELLIKINELSFLNEYTEQFSKVLLLATASYFEDKVVSIIPKFLNPANCPLTENFISKKGLKRQYHTLFDWESNNANTFFSLFGDEFKTFMGNKLDSDQKLKDSIKSFIELGSLRNRLVHNNYAQFQLDKTVNEIFEKFEVSSYFVDKMETFAEEFRQESNNCVNSDG